MRKILALLFTIPMAAAVFLAGCSNDSGQAAKKPAKPDIKIHRITESAWLRDTLPSGALAYIRVPNLWFGFSSLENGFKYAQGNEAHVQQLKNIQSGLYANWLDSLQPGARIVSYLFARHMTAPLEVAVIPSQGGQQMPPMLVMATMFDFDTVEAFKAAFEPLVQLSPDIRFARQTDSNGKGAILVQGLGVHYRFDVASKHFEMVASMGPATGLDQVVGAMVANPRHPMYEVEEQTDTSKAGLFVWLSPKAILPVVKPFIAPQQAAQFAAMGLDSMDSVSLGYGVANGKTRMQLLVEMPDVGVRQLLPIVNNSFPFESVGEPSLLAAFSVPTPAQLARIEAGIVSMEGRLPEQYLAFKQRISEELGVTLEELLGIMGPEIVYFEDELGEFVAARIGDREAFDKVLGLSAESDQLSYTKRKMGSIEMHHLVMPMIDAADLESVPVGGPQAMLYSLVDGLNSHYFWVEEGDFLIYSPVPQTLAERGASKNKVSVGDWLTEHQRQDLSGSILGLSGTVDQLSRKTYSYYLQGLQMLADLAGAEFDIFVLPPASKLGFAERGSLSMNIDMQDKYLALEFGFEQSVTDLIYAGGSYQTVAVIGILAAVALPAYQDYVERARAAEPGY